MSPVFVVLLILWLIWAACLFGGFAFGKIDRKREHRIARPLRMASSLMLVIAAWLFALIESPPAFGTLPVFIAAGMTLGLVGDLFMAGLIGGRISVIGGMGAFGLGHIVYVTGLLLYGVALGLRPDPFALGLLIWLSAGLFGWVFAVYRAPERTPLHLIALPYALLLSATAGVATGHALSDSRFWIMALGAALFLLSDLILAAQLFRGLKFDLIGDVVWLTYGPGQMLIVYTLIVAAAGLI